MKQYEAKYTINHGSVEIDCDRRSPDHTTRDSYRFQATDDDKARQMAALYRQDLIKKNYFPKSVNLDELLRITPVNLTDEKKS